MKKKIFLMLLFIAFSVSINIDVCATINEQKTNEELKNVSLLDSKTSLEIDKLKSDKENSNVTIKFQLITAIGTAATTLVSILTMCFTINNQIKTFKMQSEQNKKQQMTNYLSQIASEDRPTKIGAVQALGSYEEAFPYIVNVLKSEADYFVKNAAITTLINGAEKSIKILINESKSIQVEKIKLAGELLALDEPESEVISLLSINDNEFKEWKKDESLENAKNQLLRDIYIHLKIGDLTKEKICFNEKKKILLKVDLLQNVFKNLLEITARVIEKLGPLGKHYSIEGAYLPTIKLSEVDLSNWNLSKVNFTNAQLKKCIFRNTNFDGAILKNTSFREGYFKNNVLNGDFLDNCNFSKCKFENLEFNNITSYGMIFKGAEFEVCEFIKCEFHEPKMQGIKFVKVKIEDTKFYNANFMNAIIDSKNTFDNVEFIGSRFDGANNIDTEFNNCKMDAVRFDNTTYKNCTLNKVKYKDIKMYDNYIFENNKVNQIQFQSVNETFRRYFEEVNEIPNLDLNDQVYL